MQVAVSLTVVEMEIAALVASKRQIENLFKQRVHAYEARPEDGWQLHIEGAAGEMAVAKWSRRYWNGNLGDLGADDVGRLQVRTASRHTSRLILHPADPDDRAFILVTGLSPHFVLRGWVWGAEGKQQRFWADPSGKNRPAFFVPQDALRPMKAPGDAP